MASTADEFFDTKKQTYQGFKRLIFWSSAACLLVLALMAIFLT